MSPLDQTLIWSQTNFQRLLVFVSIVCLLAVLTFWTQGQNFRNQKIINASNHSTGVGPMSSSGPLFNPSVNSRDQNTRRASPLPPPTTSPSNQQQQQRQEKQGKHRTFQKDILGLGKQHLQLEKHRIKEIRRLCGEICKEKRPVHVTNAFFGKVKKAVNCRNLFKMDLLESNSSNGGFPPMEIPLSLRKFFSYDGKVWLPKMYANDANGKMHRKVWTKEMVESLVRKNQMGEFQCMYGPWPPKTIFKALDNTVPTFQGMRTLVIGSQSPWVEAVLLSNKNISHVTTVDYVKIKSKHPQISTLTPFDIAKDFLEDDKNATKYNLVVSFSSLEHSGLGRFGDALNPWGDLASLARAWCLTETGGHAMIGVPEWDGHDEVCFNVHRVYGSIMYPQLFANWEVVHKYSESNVTWNQTKRHNNMAECSKYIQPIYVIKKT